MENIPYMKTLYIFLTRSGTLLSNLVYHLTGAQYTHVSLAFDEDLSTLYSSTRKNGYTMFPAAPAGSTSTGACFCSGRISPARSMRWKSRRKPMPGPDAARSI